MLLNIMLCIVMNILLKQTSVDRSTKGYSQHLQYLDSVKSPAKGRHFQSLRFLIAP